MSGEKMADVIRRQTVRVGTVTIGCIDHVTGKPGAAVEYRAHRVGLDGFVQIGQCQTHVGALNIIAQSLTSNSIKPPSLSATQMMNMTQLVEQLRLLGFGDVANAVAEALK